MQNLKRKSSSDHCTQIPLRSRLLKHSSTSANEDTVSSATAADPTSVLFELTDVSTLKNLPEIHARFTKIAELALRHLDLVVRNAEGIETVLEVLELEFYLWMTSCHEDPFTHGNAEQRIGGKWYFHRAPRKSLDSRQSLTSTSGYRGGTRKGLDLTIGGQDSSTSPYFSGAPSTAAMPSDEDGPRKVRGGALLRTLRHKSNGKVVSGPSLLVDEILRLSGAASISDLVENHWGGDTSAFRVPSSRDRTSTSSPSALYFRNRVEDTDDSEKNVIPRIYQSPRIGLDLSHPDTSPTRDHPRVIFLPKPYRYFIYPKLLTANGKPQTFLGILESLSPIFPLDDTECSRLKRKVAELTGMKEHSVATYLSHYTAGIDRTDLKPFVGAAGKGTSSAPATYLRLMGTLKDKAQ